MSKGSVKVFQRSDSFKFLVYLIAFLMTVMLVCFFLFIDENLFITIIFAISMIFVVLGLFVMANEKVIVSSDSIVSENFLKNRIISFKNIKRIYVKRFENAHLIMVTTSQAQIRFYGGASKKQLDEMVSYILEQIRLNDPEHFKLVNLPSYEVEDFWCQ